jgi:hypothetical protein
VRIIIALLVLLAPLAANAQLLKCVGSDGRVEYASQCPPGSKETRTGIPSTKEGPSSSGPSATPDRSVAEREADFRKRQSEGAEAQKKADAKAADDAQRRANCEQARVYLRSIQEGQRISQIDPKTGERVFLEDAGRPAELARAQSAVKSQCN